MLLFYANDSPCLLRFLERRITDIEKRNGAFASCCLLLRHFARRNVLLLVKEATRKNIYRRNLLSVICYLILARFIPAAAEKMELPRAYQYAFSARTKSKIQQFEDAYSTERVRRRKCQFSVRAESIELRFSDFSCKSLAKGVLATRCIIFNK